MTWTVLDVIEKSSRCEAYNQVYLCGLTERESMIRYGTDGVDSGIDLELCYPGPTGFGPQRVGMISVKLIRAIRECGKRRAGGERNYIGVDYFGKSLDDMSSRERIVTDILSRFDLTESKVVRAISSVTKKGRTVLLKVR